VRLNLANEGEHEPRCDRLSISAGGRGSCRGKQRSCKAAARGDAGQTGSQAAGAIGSISRRFDRNVGLIDDRMGGLFVDADELSLQRTLQQLPDVHVEEKLEPARSCR
jgi:hypothetical protein